MYLYLFNPEARKGKKLESKIKRYLTDLGVAGEFVSLPKKGDATKAVKKAIEDGVKSIVAIGGDGLIHQIIQEITHKKIELGIIPTGDTNLFAHILGINSWQSGCESLAKGKTITVDLGTIEDRYFTSSVEVTSQEEDAKKIIGIFPVRKKRKYRPITLDIKSQRSKMKLQANASSVSISTIPFSKKIDPEIDLSDQKLYIFVESKPVDEPKKNSSGKNELTVLQGESIDVNSPNTLTIKADDEPCGKTPVQIGIDPQCLDVIVPTGNNMPKILEKD